MAKFAAEEANLAIKYKMLTLDLLPYQSQKTGREPDRKSEVKPLPEN